MSAQVVSLKKWCTGVFANKNIRNGRNGRTGSELGGAKRRLAGSFKGDAVGIVVIIIVLVVVFVSSSPRKG